MTRRPLEQLDLPLGIQPVASKEPAVPPPAARRALRLTAGVRAGFQRFWDAWPKGRKTGRIAAERAFATAVARGVTIETLLDGLERAKRSQRWADGFVKNPATWLNQGCWDDDLTPAAKRGASAVEAFVKGDDQ